jgi:hypothetical protein
MPNALTLCTLLSLAATGAGVSASNAAQADIATRARGAQSVVVASVAIVGASFEKNAYGDQLIVSHAQLRIEETMKGPSRTSIAMDLEGGTVGPLTLKVSDLPSLDVGERAVFFLDETASGGHRPHLRGLGILKLDDAGRVRGTNLTLDDIRAAVKEGR